MQVFSDMDRNRKFYEFQNFTQIRYTLNPTCLVRSNDFPQITIVVNIEQNQKTKLLMPGRVSQPTVNTSLTYYTIKAPNLIPP